MNTDHDDVPADDSIAAAVRAALTRTVADRSSSPTEWTHVYARGRRRVRVRRFLVASACVIVVLGAAGVAAAVSRDDRPAVLVTGSTSTSTTTAASESAARERDAIALAHQMLEQAIVPPGAQPSTATPPPLLHGPIIEPGITGNLVAAHHLWTTGEKPTDVAAYARRHAPPGFTANGNGSLTENGGTALEVDQPLTVLPPNIYSAQLEWSVTDSGDGGSILRIDAVVGWIPPVVPTTPRQPALRVTVAGGCPSAIGTYVDVDNPVGARGPLLLPSGTPTGALICAYESGTGHGALTAQRALDASEASSLATAMNHVVMMPSIGLQHCPMDSGSTKILAFSYLGRADANVWWHASGCQTLDNGYVATTEGGNPSFYNDFAAAIGRLHR